MPANIAEEFLPETLPENPMPIVESWLASARELRHQPNSNAMTLATCDSQGQPSARIVLCKRFDSAAGTLDFFTNYTSRKGQQLADNARVAVVFHWDHQGRQVRIEGHVSPLTDADSDAYFASRPRDSQIGAWASDQSQPIASRDALIDKFDANLARFLEQPDQQVPRPPHWGGYRIVAASCELWVEGAGRVHDRARFTRELATAGQAPSTWLGTRLQP